MLVSRKHNINFIRTKIMIILKLVTPLGNRKKHELMYIELKKIIFIIKTLSNKYFLSLF